MRVLIGIRMWTSQCGRIDEAGRDCGWSPGLVGVHVCKRQHKSAAVMPSVEKDGVRGKISSAPKCRFQGVGNISQSHQGIGGDRQVSFKYAYPD
jgi:hypothetical protein